MISCCSYVKQAAGFGLALGELAVQVGARLGAGAGGGDPVQRAGELAIRRRG
jgi:hypothetical protein